MYERWINFHLSQIDQKHPIMTKTILSVSGAFISILCVVVSLIAFAASGDGLYAVLAVIFGFSAVVAIGYGVEGTSIEDFLSGMFAEKGGEQ